MLIPVICFWLAHSGSEPFVSFLRIGETPLFKLAVGEMGVAQIGVGEQVPIHVTGSVKNNQATKGGKGSFHCTTQTTLNRTRRQRRKSVSTLP